MSAHNQELRVGFCISTYLLFLSLSGLRPLRAQDAAPASPPADTLQGELRAAPASAPALTSDSSYVIGLEDVLNIDVYDFPELTRTVRVANDGAIGLPLVGQAKAAGLTTQQLQKELEHAYAKTYLQSPQITVAVREFHARPVTLTGSVEKPGLYQLIGPRTLTEMLTLAGGPSKDAGGIVSVARKGGFGELNYVEGIRLKATDQVEIDLQKLYYAHEDALNIPIHPLDTITVRRAPIVYVVGAVRSSGGFVLTDRANVTVLQALAMAGGLDTTAAKKSARIIRRRPDGSRTEIPVDLRRVLNGKSEDLDLAANDILFVPTSTAKNAGKRVAEAVVGTTSGLIIYRGHL